MVFVPRAELIPVEHEKSRYDAHESDPGYKAYLSKISDPMCSYLKSNSFGLDFGCGKTKLLAKLLEVKSHTVESYDVYFHPDKNLLEQQYDFVVMSEVIEHLRSPREELTQVISLLRPGGLLFIKTKILPEHKSLFSNWYYKRDITHVQFFSECAFGELSRIFNLSKCELIGQDLYLFRNNR